MDWKKEKISSSELERRQKEYMNAAIAMMRHARPSAQTAREPEPEAPVTVPDVIVAAKAEVSVEAEAAMSAENAEDTAIQAVEAESAEEPADSTNEAPEAEPEARESGDDRFGVYTADELLGGEYTGDGLRKAAEILEEMTKNTEMMKKLAEGEENSDTTDFPDFSGGDGERFRGEESPQTEESGCETGSSE